ncbi:Tn3 family transposase [Actinomadura miaoliensis]|uniref:Tn3 family transposase n=1 Tax=Actinomadura miaoliensis TaxID=430685 RepID=UPI003CD06C07
MGPQSRLTAPRWRPNRQPPGRDVHPVRGVGGIAYHYVADTCVALFSRFISCGVWEAVHLIEVLLANDSDVQPTAVHADTPRSVRAGLHPRHVRVRPDAPRPRFKDTTFFRAGGHLVYRHIDELFGERTPPAHVGEADRDGAAGGGRGRVGLAAVAGGGRGQRPGPGGGELAPPGVHDQRLEVVEVLVGDVDHGPDRLRNVSTGS